MTESETKKIGARVILIGIAIGLFVAFCIMSWIDGGTSWIKDFLKGLWLNIFVAIATLFYFGYLLGKKAGSDIILKKRNAFWISFKTSFVTLLLGTLLGSLVGFLFEGLPNEPFSNAAFNYIVKPFYWVAFFGLPFLLLISPFLGLAIKKHGAKTDA